ncbi:hypothetical protein Syun_026176 [Stephania yunnanensis]|uniref:Uncharacterized protein n=1 Tax=Stephania yunnanensis TaxID=152371 RepID=A0AAP0ETT5_9MAGN
MFRMHPTRICMVDDNEPKELDPFHLYVFVSSQYDHSVHDHEDMNVETQCHENQEKV